jgi:hypothetical protein
LICHIYAPASVPAEPAPETGQHPKSTFTPPTNPPRHTRLPTPDPARLPLMLPTRTYEHVALLKLLRAPQGKPWWKQKLHKNHSEIALNGALGLRRIK